jgi:hypothetical protein
MLGRYFVEAGVMLGIALRFALEIPLWWKIKLKKGNCSQI